MPTEAGKPIDLTIIPFSREQIPYCLSVAKKYRSEGQVVDVVLTDKKLGDKMKYASKIARSGMVIGENEVESGELKIKDFETGETTSA